MIGEHGPMSAERRPVAFLGLGRMGLPMALNLARSGVPVRAWNRTPRPVPDAPDTLAVVPDLIDAIAGADVVITILPDLPDVQAVLGATDGAAGALALAAPGAVVVVMGTHSPPDVRRWAAELATLGLRLVDAPVSGGDVGAQEASLSIMVGGDIDDVWRVRDLLAAMGSVVHVGPVGAGQAAKAANQIVVAATLTALGEALTLADRNGIDAATLLDVLSRGLAGSRIIELKRDKLVDRDFRPGGRASLQLKDLRFALAAAREAGVALPVTAMVDQLYAAMVAAGHGDDDHSGIVQVLEALSGPPADA
jgi:2-hydroxy-3-oxopropionate reductase